MLPTKGSHRLGCYQVTRFSKKRMLPGNNVLTGEVVTSSNVLKGEGVTRRYGSQWGLYYQVTRFWMLRVIHSTHSTYYIILYLKTEFALRQQVRMVRPANHHHRPPRSCQVRLNQIRLYQVRSGQIKSGEVR